MDENIPKSELSELWHPRYFNLRHINKDLKIAGLILEKNITSDSYRRGLAIIISKIFGIKIAHTVLNYAYFSTTKKYSDYNLTKEKIQNTMRVIYNIKNSEELDIKKNFDNISTKKFFIQIEKIVQENKIFFNEYTLSKPEDNEINKKLESENLKRMLNITREINYYKKKSLPKYIKEIIENCEINPKYLNMYKQKACLDFFLKNDKYQILAILFMNISTERELKFLQEVFLTEKYMDSLFTKFKENFE